MRGLRELWLALAFLTYPIAHASTTSAQAQGSSVKAIFEKYKLIGNFAWDCSQPPGPDNWYFVNRGLDNGFVQRDFMESATKRMWYMVMDEARETGPSEIYVAGKRESGQHGDGTWKIGADQMIVVEATFDRSPIISAGKLLRTGQALPPLKRCPG